MIKNVIFLVKIEVARAIGEMLVGGYSQVSKMSAEGRAQMNFDYQQCLHRLELVSGVKSPPAIRTYTETFIRAFYLTEDELNSKIIIFTGELSYSIRLYRNEHHVRCKNSSSACSPVWS